MKHLALLNPGFTVGSQELVKYLQLPVFAFILFYFYYAPVP